MQVWRSTRWANPAAWYAALGIVVLLLSMWVPWLTAGRTARTEGRADAIGGLLLAAAVAQVEPLDEAGLETVLARLHCAAACAGVFTADLERVDATAPGVLLLLTNKHYAFQLAEAPPSAQLIAGRDTVPAYEVVSWPLSAVGPGTSVFFHPEDGPRAFTRNLGSGFLGLGDERPKPGVCQRPPGLSSVSRLYYRSVDDKRWILY